jgi:GTPase SAR1 family protein
VVAAAASPSPSPGLFFPAGQAQARVALPALFLVVRASEALRMLDEGAPEQRRQQLDAAVAAGATAVLLVESGESDGDDDSDGGSSNSSTSGKGAQQLYDAAVRLRDFLRGRCPLLVEDRLDVATAAGCQGALLPEAGVPVVVARRMVAASAGLLGRRASTAEQAAAAAADGANFVLMGRAASAEEVTAARERQRSGNAVPVLAEVGGSGSAAAAAALAAAADGLALPLSALAPVAAALSDGGSEGAGPAVEAILAALRAGVAGGGSQPAAAAVAEVEAAAAAAAAATTTTTPSAPSLPTTTTTTPITTPRPKPLRRLLSPAREALIADERALLEDAAALLERIILSSSSSSSAAAAGASGAELSLLRESSAALEGRFNVAVVGEFNAGKSSVINALLGRRLLAEGPLPTTNEITELRFDDDADEEEGGGGQGAATTTTTNPTTADPDALDDPGRVVREADGRFVRYLRGSAAGAGLLREMNVVDTPGLNVVLERQERQTEEYVPRADLVLFVMSADRAMTGSELRILEYLRQWRKKVVFVLNKVDTIDEEAALVAWSPGGWFGGGGDGGGDSGQQQQQAALLPPTASPAVRQVAEFVSSKAEELLAIASPAVLPVSARRALRAKLEAGAAARRQLLQASSFSPPLSAEEIAASTASILAQHPAWVPSGFGALEDFVYEFLAGGEEEGDEGEGAASGNRPGATSPSLGPPRGGEGLRLKLQTPLAVADALVGAAAQQLAAQRAAAEAQVRALDAVGGQLERFRSDMRRDAASQRAAARALVDAATQRAAALVDRVVRLSNVGALSAYALGASTRLLPVAAAFDAEVAAGGVEALSQRVAEHAGWLLANCEAQAEYYASYVASVPRPDAGKGGGTSSAAPPKVQAQESSAAAASAPVASATAAGVAADAAAASSSSPTTTTAALVARSPALQSVAEFKPAAARALLEEEVREAFLGTAGQAAGAQGAALVAAGLLPTAAEDAAAFAVAALASYVAVLNLPLRRAEIKAKVSKAAGKFADEVVGKMEAEVEAATAATRERVSEMVAGPRAEWERELKRVEQEQRELEALAERLREMEVRVANV